MIQLSDYIARFNILFPAAAKQQAWLLTGNIKRILLEKIESLDGDYKVFNEVAIHKTVTIDSHAIIKGPAIISPNCFIGAHSYIRGGVFLDESVSLGPGCEVETTYIFSHSALAHFNFVGDSLIGSHVNLEAGAVVANHYNERREKNISVRVNGAVYSTGVEKFGALVGDNTRIGANAVLSPGTILLPNAVVGRLELVDQCPADNSH